MSVLGCYDRAEVLAFGGKNLQASRCRNIQIALDIYLYAVDRVFALYGREIEKQLSVSDCAVGI